MTSVPANPGPADDAGYGEPGDPAWATEQVTEDSTEDSTEHGTARAAEQAEDDDTSAGLSRDSEYAHLVPKLTEYAQLDGTDPRRESLRDELVTGYLPVAQHIARRFANRGEPLDDLIQVATVGLINAVDRFEPDRGSDFFSFAVPTISGEVRRHFRDQGWSMRVPRRLKDLHVSINAAVAELSQSLGRAPRPSELAEKLGLPTNEVLEGLAAGQAYRGSSLDEILSGDQSGTTLGDLLGEADAELERVDYQQSLQPLLAELPDRERTILMLRFFGNKTQTQIADQVGVSQMHVSRLLAQTLARMRDRLETGEE
ncbi:MAG: polymerase sigma-B factor [Pseudonocardiales bacterium]|nr:polymerase sigma-B factor [Pseudonocardiales bacterium]